MKKSRPDGQFEVLAAKLVFLASCYLFERVQSVPSDTSEGALHETAWIFKSDGDVVPLVHVGPCVLDSLVPCSSKFSKSTWNTGILHGTFYNSLSIYFQLIDYEKSEF